MFSSEGHKDSAANIEASKEFVCNLATFDLRLENERDVGGPTPWRQ